MSLYDKKDEIEALIEQARARKAAAKATRLKVFDEYCNYIRMSGKCGVMGMMCDDNVVRLERVVRSTMIEEDEAEALISSLECARTDFEETGNIDLSDYMNPMPSLERLHTRVVTVKDTGDKSNVCVRSIGSNTGFDMPHTIYRRALSPAVCAYENRVIVIGGRDGSNALASAETIVLDELPKWQLLPTRMSAGRDLFCGALFGDGVFIVAGGTNSYATINVKTDYSYRMPIDYAERDPIMHNHPYKVYRDICPVALASCEKLDLKTMTFRDIAPMNFARCEHQLVTYKGAVYAIGGNYVNEYVLECEMYDGTTWNVVAPLPVGRKQFGACVTGVLVVVCGGECADMMLSQQVIAYDGVRWSVYDYVLPRASPFASCFDLDGKLVVMSAKRPRHFYWDPELFEWVNEAARRRECAEYSWPRHFTAVLF